MQKCSGQANETETLGVGSIKLSTSGVSERMFIPSCSPFWQSFSAVFGEGGRSIRLASCLLLAPPAQTRGAHGRCGGQYCRKSPYHTWNM